MTSTGLKRLKVWVEAKDLALLIYREVIPCLPLEEKWELASQIRRASTSIPANIAEGYGRFYYQANIQFCYNARGSLEELISHLSMAVDLGYLPENIGSQGIAKADALVILINGYIAYLRKSKQGLAESKELGHSICDGKSEYLLGDVGVEVTDFNDSPFSTLVSLK
jgi:four helix bundle protein